MYRRQGCDRMQTPTDTLSILYQDVLNVGMMIPMTIVIVNRDTKGSQFLMAGLFSAYWL